MPIEVQRLHFGDSLPTRKLDYCWNSYYRDLEKKNLTNVSKMDNFPPDSGPVVCFIWNETKLNCPGSTLMLVDWLLNQMSSLGRQGTDHWHSLAPRKWSETAQASKIRVESIHSCLHFINKTTDFQKGANWKLRLIVLSGKHRVRWGCV